MKISYTTEVGYESSAVIDNWSIFTLTANYVFMFLS